MPGDDVPGDAQPQRGSLALGLGGEDGSEDGRQDVVGGDLATIDDLVGHMAVFVAGRGHHLMNKGC